MNAVGVRDFELSVTLCGDKLIQQFNLEWRGLDEPTDVLSFISDPEVDPIENIQSQRQGCFGDLVISMDTLQAHSAYFQVSLEEELKRVSIHGILHLLGWDHETNEPDEPMLVQQEKVLSQIKEKIF